MKNLFLKEKVIVEVKGYDKNMLPTNILPKIYMALNDALDSDLRKNGIKFKLKPSDTCEKIKNLIYLYKKTY